VRIGLESPLVLGSASPRRRELIATLGIPFVVVAADIDESMEAGETPDRYLTRIVAAKLDAVRSVCEKDRSLTRAAAGILVADTVVVAPDGSTLGKPGDDALARVMLARTAGATHEVCTRFALGHFGHALGPSFAQTVITRVTFRSLTRVEVDDYVACGEGRDKAGGYAVQGRAAAFVESIDGSYTNVVGLPLCQVVVAMRDRGWLGSE
jgi:septum formation protein